MPIYKQSVNVRRMSCVYHHATWQIYFLDVRLGPCMAFLFMSRHLQYLLVLWLWSFEHLSPLHSPFNTVLWQMSGLGFANPAIFSKPGFSGLESSKPGFWVRVCQWLTDGHRSVFDGRQACNVSRPSVILRPIHRLPNCFLCTLALSAACTKY